MKLDADTQQPLRHTTMKGDYHSTPIQYQYWLDVTKDLCLIGNVYFIVLRV